MLSLTTGADFDKGQYDPEYYTNGLSSLLIFVSIVPKAFVPPGVFLACDILQMCHRPLGESSSAGMFDRCCNSLFGNILVKLCAL
jgi:hypothetical protein